MKRVFLVLVMGLLGINVAFGDSSNFVDDTKGNFFAGLSAGKSITTGRNNVGIGQYAGYGLTTGSRNVLIGNGAGFSLTTESDMLYITTGVAGNYGISGSFRLGTFSFTGALDIEGDVKITGTLYGDTISDQLSYSLAAEMFDIDQSISALYVWMTPSDAGTEVDLSPHALDLTYTDASNFSTSDLVQQGSLWALDFDGVNDYLFTADDADWSFDGSSDAAVSIGGWIEVVAHTDSQGVIDKYTASGTPQREWAIFLDSAEKLTFALFDEADDKITTNKTTAALDAGWHFVVHTYDGTAGATALTEANALWYVDGASVADTNADDGDFTNMVGGTSIVHVGCLDFGVLGNYFQGNMGMLFVANSEWSADNVWQAYLTTRGLLGE